MTVEAAALEQEKPPRRVRLAFLAGPGVTLWIVYSLAGTWTLGRTFGGQGDDGGWVDSAGRPTSTPPPVVNVQGHPALWVGAVLVAILLGTALWASRLDGVHRRRREWIGTGIATVFIVAVVLIFTVLQTQLIGAAFDRGDPHPPILGDVTVTTHPMSAG